MVPVSLGKDMPERLLVAAAIFVEDGRVLLAQRPEDDPLAGLWELPGGKVEEDETPEGCLTRKLAEECGITVSVGRKFAASSYSYPHATITLIAYLITQWTGEIIAHEHSEVRWVGLDDLKQLTLSPAEIPILQRLRRELS